MTENQLWPLRSSSILSFAYPQQSCWGNYLRDLNPMTKEHLLKARHIAIEIAAWVAVIAVLTYRLLSLSFDFICDRVLPLLQIFATHVVLAWQDYEVNRVEHRLTPTPSSKLRTPARGFK